MMNRKKNYLPERNKIVCFLDCKIRSCCLCALVPFLKFAIACIASMLGWINGPSFDKFAEYFIILEMDKIKANFNH